MSLSESLAQPHARRLPESLGEALPALPLEAASGIEPLYRALQALA